jgi:hypothetical protein
MRGCSRSTMSSASIARARARREPRSRKLLGRAPADRAVRGSSIAVDPLRRAALELQRPLLLAAADRFAGLARVSGLGHALRAGCDRMLAVAPATPAAAALAAWRRRCSTASSASIARARPSRSPAACAWCRPWPARPIRSRSRRVEAERAARSRAVPPAAPAVPPGPPGPPGPTGPPVSTAPPPGATAPRPVPSSAGAGPAPTPSRAPRADRAAPTPAPALAAARSVDDDPLAAADHARSSGIGPALARGARRPRPRHRRGSAVAGAAPLARRARRSRRSPRRWPTAVDGERVALSRHRGRRPHRARARAGLGRGPARRRRRAAAAGGRAVLRRVGRHRSSRFPVGAACALSGLLKQRAGSVGDGQPRRARGRRRRSARRGRAVIPRYPDIPGVPAARLRAACQAAAARCAAIVDDGVPADGGRPPGPAAAGRGPGRAARPESGPRPPRP